MKYCVNGLGFMHVCGKLATTRREGWPLCEHHAAVWDGFESATTDDFVAYSREAEHA